MKISTKGQVTIPLNIRKRLGLLPHTEVVFSIKGSDVILTKNYVTNRRGKNLLKNMTGKASVKMTTDEIMNLTRA
jgi:AbrB family looped-hinge helix DNA binding protein